MASKDHPYLLFPSDSADPLPPAERPVVPRDEGRVRLDTAYAQPRFWDDLAWELDELLFYTFWEKARPSADAPSIEIPDLTAWRVPADKRKRN